MNTNIPQEFKDWFNNTFIDKDASQLDVAYEFYNRGLTRQADNKKQAQPFAYFMKKDNAGFVLFNDDEVAEHKADGFHIEHKLFTAPPDYYDALEQSAMIAENMMIPPTLEGVAIASKIRNLIPTQPTQGQNEWISVKDRLPEHEQNIEGLNSLTGGTWSEVFDKLEPLGFMTHWKPAAPTPDNRSE
jgi:hypothetical protein